MTVEHVSSEMDQESVEIDDFLDDSIGGSSLLFFNGEVKFNLRLESLLNKNNWCNNLSLRLFFFQTNSEETNVDLPSPSLKR